MLGVGLVSMYKNSLAETTSKIPLQNRMTSILIYTSGLRILFQTDPESDTPKYSFGFVGGAMRECAASDTLINRLLPNHTMDLHDPVIVAPMGL
jgi:hypothetical protein